MKYYWVLFNCLSKNGSTLHETVITRHPFTINEYQDDDGVLSWLNQFGNVHTLLNWKEITEEEYRLHPEGAE